MNGFVVNNLGTEITEQIKENYSSEEYTIYINST